MENRLQQLYDEGGSYSRLSVKADEVAGTVDEKKGIGSITIANNKGSSLPSTGGIGTTIFTIGGCLIMIIAAALFFASRRKENK